MSKVSAFSVVALGVALMSGDVPLKADGLKLTLANRNGVDVTYKNFDDHRVKAEDMTPLHKRLGSQVGGFVKGVGGVVGGGVTLGARAVSAPVNAIARALSSEPERPQSAPVQGNSQQRSMSVAGEFHHRHRERSSGMPLPSNAFKKEVERLEAEYRAEQEELKFNRIVNSLKKEEPPVDTRRNLVGRDVQIVRIGKSVPLGQSEYDQGLWGSTSHKGGWKAMPTSYKSDVSGAEIEEWIFGKWVPKESTCSIYDVSYYVDKAKSGDRLRYRKNM